MFRRSEYAFRDDGIEFRRYPFQPAAVYPKGFLPVSAILEYAANLAPPAVLTNNGELLFISAEQKDDLEKFAATHDIPRRPWHDIWSDILEPFVDTSFSEVQQRRTLQRLAQVGLSEEEVHALRQAHEKAMIAYNIDSGLWDWCYLGLHDLLNAYNGYFPVCAKHQLPHDQFEKLYWKAMGIAMLGRPESERANHNSAG